MMKMNIRHMRNFLSNYHSQTNKRGNFISSQPLRQCMYNRRGDYSIRLVLPPYSVPINFL